MGGERSNSCQPNGIGIGAGSRLANSELCTTDRECASGHCADGRFCAPRDGTGRAGDYCHHNNQCERGLVCHCARDIFGFCIGWRQDDGQGRAVFRLGFSCQREGVATRAQESRPAPALKSRPAIKGRPALKSLPAIKCAQGMRPNKSRTKCVPALSTKQPRFRPGSQFPSYHKPAFPPGAGSPKAAPKGQQLPNAAPPEKKQ